MKNKASFIFILAVFFGLFMGLEADSQVINNDIEERLELSLNEPLSSNTTDCTVQWSCLNRALTAKCIQYHNDQWFFFKTTDLEKYFINISKQDCRDLRGVQIVVINGKPCEPKSYQIVSCVSLGDQNDIFITLDSLKSNEDYLVLIDGYLHDFCEFSIEFSDTPNGFPIVGKELAEMKTEQIDGLRFNISWQIPDSISKYIRRFEVYRRNKKDFKSIKIHEVELGLNSRGLPLLYYIFEDVLPDYGNYYYKIIGVGDFDRILISSSLLSYNRQGEYHRLAKNWLQLDLDYPEDCNLKISVYDAYSQSLLKRYDFKYNSSNKVFNANIKEFMDKGIFYYRIEVVDTKTMEKKSHLQMK